MRATRSSTLSTLSMWMVFAVLAELTLLRTGTRTLIHIPGLGRYDFSIGLLSEVGRFAYYLAVVLVVATLTYLGKLAWNGGAKSGEVAAGLIWSYLFLALAARIGIVADTVTAWFAVVVLVALVPLTWSGARSLPMALFVAASTMASWAILGQGTGGGLSGATVDMAIVVAEGLLILAAVTTPLLLKARIRRQAVIAGSVVGALFLAGFSFGGSTLSILTLWNLGVPGWFSPIAYGLGLGCLSITLWSSITSQDTQVACIVVLMVAAGVGPISTYQTGLGIAAVALAGLPRQSTMPKTVLHAKRDTVGDLVPLS